MNTLDELTPERPGKDVVTPDVRGALQVHLRHVPGGQSLGVKGDFCVQAHLITGPIWSVPTVKQTPVLKEMGFRRRIYCSYRSLDQLSNANYFPLLVALAKCNCCCGVTGCTYF